MSKVDFIIVGAGAAGAAAAWKLCSKGHSVVCVERGPTMDASLFPTSQKSWEKYRYFDFDPVASRRAGKFDIPVDDSSSPIAVCNFSAVGGSTILYSAHFPRFLPTDFRTFSTEGVGKDWPIEYCDLKPYFTENEYHMGVSGLAGDPFYPDVGNVLPPVPLGEVGTFLARALNKKKWHWWPSFAAISTRQVRGRSACLNLGPCNLGCPQGAKSSVDLTYIARAKTLGLILFDEFAVTEILMKGRSAIGVKGVNKKGETEEIFGEHVVLAASAIGTPRLLLNTRTKHFPNGLGNNFGAVGRNLMMHPLGYVEGIFERKFDTDNGPQGALIHSLEFYRRKESQYKLGFMIQGLRGSGVLDTAVALQKRRKLEFGKNIYENVNNSHRKKVAMTIICEDLPELENRVELDKSNPDKFGCPGVKIHYKLHGNTKKMMSTGLSEVKKFMIDAGARSTAAFGPVRESGWHLMGTAGMGIDEKISVVCPRGKVHGTKNLYVVDSSVFVSSSCVNPANTIQAISLYLSDGMGANAR